MASAKVESTRKASVEAAESAPKLAFGQFVTLWRSWSSARRYSTLGAVVLAIAGVLTLALGTRSSGRLAPLLTRLGPADAQEITARLGAHDVPYEFAAGGTALLVPEDRVLSLRLELASEGLPRGAGVGFEIFDDPKIGLSRFAERLNYRRGMEGELTRTIRQLEVVSDARVHIVLPEPSLFTQRDRRATASVAIQLHRGRSLSKDQVDAIRHLVSSSVEGLNPDDVTLVDNQGHLLAKGGDRGRSAAELLEQQRELEDTLERRARRIIERVTGEGRASVEVTAELDVTQTERTMESFDPDSAVLRSSQTSEEQRNKAGQEPGGVPGAPGNLVGRADPAASPAASPAAIEGALAASKRTETKNFELNKVTSREVSPSPRIRRISVAVLVDATNDGRERSSDELAGLADLVKNAVGFDAARGDQVVVQAMPFDHGPPVPPPPSTPAWLARLEAMWPIGAGALALLIGAAVVLSRRRSVVQELLPAPRTLGELQALVSSNSDAELVLDGSILESGSLLDRVRQDPSRAAAVLKLWMEEDSHA
ncbi:MAG: flagellar M-ring protein FliF [Deltaproteobacteria bacterium]|nr:flagellar M-ring protein FliF [Deltaproteobacteria bacterium]